MSSEKEFGAEAIRVLMNDDRLGEGEGLARLYRWDREGELPGIYLAHIDERCATPSEIRAMTGGLASGNDANPIPLLSLPCTLSKFMAFENCAGLFLDRLQDGRDTEAILNEIAAQNEDAASLARGLLGVPESEQAAESDTPDYSMFAEPDELIEAFGKCTGMSKEWFENLTDRPGLKKARRFPGKSGRGGHKPLFCPLAVMQWLATGKRRGGAPMPEKTGWRLLELHFPQVYNVNSVADPRQG